MIDVVLISTGWLLPADGSAYIMSPEKSKLFVVSETKEFEDEWIQYVYSEDEL